MEFWLGFCAGVLIGAVAGVAVTVGALIGGFYVVHLFCGKAEPMRAVGK